MKIKKAAFLLFATLLTFSLFGCSSSDSTDTPLTGIPNPMVEVSGVSDFKDQLGIDLDDSFLPTDAKYFIYSEQMLEIQFSEVNVNNEEVEIRFRAQKNTDEDISGMYGTFTEDEIPDNDLSIKHRYQEDNTVNIYDIKNTDTTYCVCVIGNTSGMQLASIMDKALVTFGIDSTFS